MQCSEAGSLELYCAPQLMAVLDMIQNPLLSVQLNDSGGTGELVVLQLIAVVSVCAAQ